MGVASYSAQLLEFLKVVTNVMDVLSFFCMMCIRMLTCKYVLLIIIIRRRHLETSLT